MSVLGQAQADLPRTGFVSGRGGAELFDAEGIIDADFFATVEPSSVTLNVYTGSTWVAGALKRWNGTSWDSVTLKYWNDSAWV